MNQSLPKVTYKGFRTSNGWEVVVARYGEPLRLLDKPRLEAEWALSILTNYLGDQAQAADLHQDFAWLTINRLTEDWELSGSDIESALTEVEILRARWRIALVRG